MTRRAAVIGCGKIGSAFADDPRVRGVYSHAGAFAASSRVCLIAVCDADDARAKSCARRWGLADSYTDVVRLLGEARPEIVSICTPDATHASVLRSVLAADSVKGVLAEKPLTTRVTEAEEIVSMAANAGVALAVNYIRRYASSHTHIREAIAGGALGAIQSVNGLYSGGLVHNGTHWFDLVRWLIGEIVTVQGFPSAEMDADPSPDVRLEFAMGAKGYLHGCRREAFGVFETDIVGTVGRIRIVDSGHRIETYTVGDNPNYTGYRALLRVSDESDGVGDALVNAVEDLVDCIAADRTPRCSGADAVAALRVAEAARASVEAGRALRVTSGRP